MKIVRKIFTSSASWVVPSGVSHVRVLGRPGAGGGGGGGCGGNALSSDTPCGAGAGGSSGSCGYAAGILGPFPMVLTPGTQYTFTIGSGGTGGSGGTNSPRVEPNRGNDGSYTEFGPTLGTALIRWSIGASFLGASGGDKGANGSDASGVNGGFANPPPASPGGLVHYGLTCTTGGGYNIETLGLGGRGGNSGSTGNQGDGAAAKGNNFFGTVEAYIAGATFGNPTETHGAGGGGAAGGNGSMSESYPFSGLSTGSSPGGAGGKGGDASELGQGQNGDPGQQGTDATNGSGGGGGGGGGGSGAGYIGYSSYGGDGGRGGNGSDGLIMIEWVE